MRSWFVHIQGETLGPLPTETICLMIRQNRLQFLDYVWAEHLTKWHRIVDLDEFAALAPAYPQVPIPSRDRSPESRSERATAPSRAESPAPAPAPANVVGQGPDDAGTPKRAGNQNATAPPPSASKTRQWLKVRRFVRVPVQSMFAELKDHGSHEVVNLSEGGIFIRNEPPLPVGTELKLTLDMRANGKRLDMTGVVIRQGTVGAAAGVAIEFTRLNPAHKRLLHQYVEERDPGR